MDQRRATSAIRRKEPRISMTVVGLILALFLTNAYAIMGQYNAPTKDFKEVKLLVAMQLILTYKKKNKRKAIEPIESLKTSNTNHVLLSYKQNKRRECFVCSGLLKSK